MQINELDHFFFGRNTNMSFKSFGLLIVLSCLLSSKFAERCVLLHSNAWRQSSELANYGYKSVMVLRGGTADLSASQEPELAVSQLSEREVASNKLCEEGWSMYGEGDALEAERLFLASLRENPSNVEACSKLALLNEFEKGDLEKAEQLYRKVRALKPSECSCHVAHALPAVNAGSQMMSVTPTTLPSSYRKVNRRCFLLTAAATRAYLGPELLSLSLEPRRSARRTSTERSGNTSTRWPSSASPPHPSLKPRPPPPPNYPPRPGNAHRSHRAGRDGLSRSGCDGL